MRREIIIYILAIFILCAAFIMKKAQPDLLAINTFEKVGEQLQKQSKKTINIPTTKQSVKIVIENPSSFERQDEPIIIERETLKKYFNEVPANQVINITNSSNLNIPSQCDDLNGDKIWDELSFVYSFNKMERAELTLTLIDKDSLPRFKKRTHGRLAVSKERNGVYTSVTKEERPKDLLPQSSPMLYQYEGPGWENELVAFRSYFDSRNGKDIFGKKEKILVLDTIGLDDGNYHQMANWGLDILKVGNSLGAGALALYDQGKIYRLGQTEKATYELIADGPVRTIIRLQYNGWDVNGKSLNLTEDITIWAGKYWYKSSVAISGLQSGEELVIGIVNLKNEKKRKTILNLKNSYKGILSYEKQSEVNDQLGMGLLIPSSKFVAFGETPNEAKGNEIGNTFYGRIKVENNKQSEFYFFACWEKATEKFQTEQGVIKEIENEAARLHLPVKIAVYK